MTTTRTKLATSHDGKYSYWLDTGDRYVYQRNEISNCWVGWYCAQSAWDLGMGRAQWITPVTEVA